MPFNIQYDKDTGAITATVLGNFIPVVKDNIKQVIFDSRIETSGLMVNPEEVKDDDKIYEAGKDEGTILKPDPDASTDPIESTDPI